MGFEPLYIVAGLAVYVFLVAMLTILAYRNGRPLTLLALAAFVGLAFVVPDNPSTVMDSFSGNVSQGGPLGMLRLAVLAYILYSNTCTVRDCPYRNRGCKR